MPWRFRQPQSSVQKLLNYTSYFNLIANLVLLEEMIINHCAQMLLCEENRHREPAWKETQAQSFERLDVALRQIKAENGTIVTNPQTINGFDQIDIFPACSIKAAVGAVQGLALI